MLRSFLVFTVVLIAAQPTPLGAQTGAVPEQVTLEEVVAATKIYFRDTAEFPVLEHTLLTVTDRSGRVRKRHEGFYDYLVEGYPSGNHDVTVSTYFPDDTSTLSAMRQMWNGTLKAAIASNVHSMFPAYVMLAGQARGTLTIVNQADDGVLTARLLSSFECPAFAFSVASLYMPAIVCGESEIELRPDLSMQRFVFEQGGLPASVKVGPFGKTLLQSFHVEIEFQEVTVAPDPEPYVVPQRIETTLVTAKGTLSIVSDYTATGPGTLKNRMRLQARDAPRK